MAKVTYTCFAIPPEGILVGKIYETGKDSNGSFYTDGIDKVYANEDYIKMIFSEAQSVKTAKK